MLNVYFLFKDAKRHNKRRKFTNLYLNFKEKYRPNNPATVIADMKSFP